jgi:solute carrier family 25 carnitine/acylcarnitine transporter 20/29
VTAVVAPVELVKCVMQNDRGFRYANSRQCLRSILKEEGVAGLFRGSFSTAAREVPSYAIQFATYEYLKLKYVTP